VRFADSQVIAHVVGKVMEAPAHPDNRPLNTIPGLDAILKKIGAAAAKLDSAEFLRKNLNQLASQYGLTLEQVRAVRRAVLGIDAKK
jgi:hypothetical protein